jgi:hypothetical protein
MFHLYIDMGASREIVTVVKHTIQPTDAGATLPTP